MVWLYSGGKAAPSWSRDSLHSLYHYMRCSQLENQGHEACTSIQVHTVHTVHSLYHYTFLVSFTVFFSKACGFTLLDSKHVPESKKISLF